MMITEMENIYLKLLNIQNTMNKNLSNLAKDYGFNQTEMLVYLDVKANPATNLNDVCNRIGLKKSAASKTIDKLIKEGRLIRNVNELDNRKISLTHIELENDTLCQREVLMNTFNERVQEYDLPRINAALSDTLRILGAQEKPLHLPPNHGK